MASTRVFISFDYDHDEILKTFLVGQSRLGDSPFTLADWSIKEAIDKKWKDKARTRIRAVDTVAVICGTHTHTATGVSAEVTIAQEEGISYFLLQGYKERTCTKPLAAKTSDRLYEWSWPNLKALVGGGR